MIEVGTWVTPKERTDVNFGKPGRVVRVNYEEVYVNFNGAICLYFEWMVRHV